MERLTYRENDWVGVHDQTDGVVSTNSQAVHRLAEYEDFMEEQGFKSLEELKNRLYFDKNLILDLEKIRTDKNNPLKPRFYYDENLGNEYFPFAFCARPYDHNMSLHSFMKNGVLCAYASEHYDTWCKNTKPIKEMNFNEWAVKFIMPLIQENKELKDMWDKLKEWLISIIKEKQKSPKYFKLYDVLEKIQELEKENKGE